MAFIHSDTTSYYKYMYNVCCYENGKISNGLFQNPELEARIQKLKAEQENRQYADMVKNVNNKVSVTAGDKNISILHLSCRASD